MNITSIQVSAGRTFNHPHEPYANFRFDLHLKADLNLLDDSTGCLKFLQSRAEKMADEHKEFILDRCELQNEREQLRYQISNLMRPIAEWEDTTPEARAADLEKAKARLITVLQELGIYSADEPCLHPGHPDHPETHERH